MADYAKLFLDKRLNMIDHEDIIKSRLAYMKLEDPKSYDDYSSFYGVDMEVTVVEDLQKKPIKRGIGKKSEDAPVTTTKADFSKKRGRPSSK